MSEQDTILEHLTRQGVSRRSFLKFCTLAASSLALPLSSVSALAEVLGASARPKVIWISGQECTGCSESLLRAYDDYPVERLILEMISLDYHSTLMAPSGTAAEDSRLQAIAGGGQVVIIDGSVPMIEGGVWSVIGGRTAIEVVRESVVGAALVVAVGNCASYGGLPKASPNPTQAHGIDDLVKAGLLTLDSPLINIPGCPPIAEVLTGVLVNFILSGGAAPELDGLKRPKTYYGNVVHDSCSRKPHYLSNQFATSFDDIGAQQGYCLIKLGCKGTVTFNACTTTQWNGGTSFPMKSGHGCLGCSEPDFWDQPGGFYHSLLP